MLYYYFSVIYFIFSALIGWIVPFILRDPMDIIFMVGFSLNAFSSDELGAEILIFLKKEID